MCSKQVWLQLFSGVALILFALPVMAYQAPWLFAAELASGYDSNVGNAGVSADRRSDVFAEFAIRGNRLYMPGDFISLELEGALRGRYYDSYEDLSFAAPEGVVRLNYRPAASFRTPTLTGEAVVGYREYASRLRDGGYYRLGLTLKQPLNTRLTGRVNTTWNRRLAGNAVFDYEFYSLGLSLDWQVFSRLLVYAGGARREGGLVSTSRDDAAIEQVARAWLPDDAIVDPDEEQLAYRLDTSADRYFAGLNYALKDGLSLDMQAQHQEADTYGGISYRRYQLMAALMLRF